MVFIGSSYVRNDDLDRGPEITTSDQIVFKKYNSCLGRNMKAVLVWSESNFTNSHELRLHKHIHIEAILHDNEDFIR